MPASINRLNGRDVARREENADLREGIVVCEQQIEEMEQKIEEINREWNQKIEDMKQKLEEMHYQIQSLRRRNDGCKLDMMS